MATNDRDQLDRAYVDQGDPSRADPSRGYQDAAQQRAAADKKIAEAKEGLAKFAATIMDRKREQPKLAPPTPKVEESLQVFAPRTLATSQKDTALLLPPQQQGGGSSIQSPWSLVTKGSSGSLSWGVFHYSDLRLSGKPGDVFSSLTGLASLNLSTGMHAVSQPASIYLECAVNPDYTTWDSTGPILAASIKVGAQLELPGGGRWELTTSPDVPAFARYLLGTAQNDGSGGTLIVPTNPGILQIAQGFVTGWDSGVANSAEILFAYPSPS